VPTNGQSWLCYDWAYLTVETNGGDWPLAFVTLDGNSQPVEFIKPNAFHRQDDCFADDLSLRLPKFT